jgi:hypothetical protein
MLRSSARDLAIVLRRYGFLGIDPDGTPVGDRFNVCSLGPGSALPETPVSLVIADRSDRDALPGLTQARVPGGSWLYERRAFPFLPRRRRYRALLDHAGFFGPDLTPIWTTARGHTAIGWWQHAGRRHLLVGLDLVEELVRYTQGDPAKVMTAKDKTLWGFGHERAAYLFEDNLVRGSEMEPWADRLGFTVVRALSEATGLPLAAPLPGGAKGAILLTGDDDQAWLEKYENQRRILDGFPITYLLLPHTKHTRETLANMPANVEYGVHVDALEQPERYDQTCAEQTAAVRGLTGRRSRTVRNHGHLNRGYWTQLNAWQQNGLTLDFNIRGLDGTCPTGSYLPFRVRRADGSWSDHWSLFSTFSDSMLGLQKWPEAKQIDVITKLTKSIESSSPGVVVLNFHPQNVDDIPNVHRAVTALGRRPSWVALGGESYAEWIEALEDVRMVVSPSGVGLTSPRLIEGLALVWPGRSTPVPVPAWRGEQQLVPSGAGPA